MCINVDNKPVLLFFFFYVKAIIDPKTEQCAAGRVIRNCFVKNGEKVVHIQHTLISLIAMLFCFDFRSTSSRRHNNCAMNKKQKLL